MANEIKTEQVIDRAEHDGRGPDCMFILEWNSSTSKSFDRGRAPKQGRKYILKCLRYDGKRGYFGLEQI